MLKGKIVKNISNLYTILSDGVLYECIPRGRFRKDKKTPLVGDEVMFDEKELCIREILPRKNMLMRPSVANIDVGLIVTSMAHPSFDPYLLDAEISLITLSHMEPVICFTKLDIMNEKEKKLYQKIREYYERIGIPTYDNDHCKSLLKDLKGKVVVLTGQSGSGKSTLLNRMDSSLQLKTNEISEALNRGKHTTRHSEIFAVKNVYFCDTPGFSSLSFQSFTKQDISASFKEFQEYPCKFRDCHHNKEIKCGVKEAVEKGLILKTRYASYLKMEGEGK